jgi:membrane protein insertase Oxa1/YidC/SpoIIIJ
VLKRFASILAAIIILRSLIILNMATITENPTTNAEKLKALKLTIDKIDKDYGKGSVMMMNEKMGSSRK